MKWAPLSDTRTRGNPDGGTCVRMKMITQYAAVRAQAVSRRASIEPGLIHGSTHPANGGIRDRYAASDPAGAGSGAGADFGATGAGAGCATCAAASLFGSTG